MVLIKLFRVLLATCIILPYRLAFQDESEKAIGWIITNAYMDFSFAIDIFVNFFSAYYDLEFMLIDDRKVMI